MADNFRAKGGIFEEVACEYLENQGYTLLEKNYTVSGGEIDLIMTDKDFIVFVEVKSLSSKSEFSIYTSVTNKKRYFLSKAINTWLRKKNKLNEPWRLDFVGIVHDGDNMQIEHFKFLPIKFH